MTSITNDRAIATRTYGNQANSVEPETPTERSQNDTHNSTFTERLLGIYQICTSEIGNFFRSYDNMTIDQLIEASEESILEDAVFIDSKSGDMDKCEADLNAPSKDNKPYYESAFYKRISSDIKRFKSAEKKGEDVVSQFRMVSWGRTDSKFFHYKLSLAIFAMKQSQYSRGYNPDILCHYYTIKEDSKINRAITAKILGTYPKDRDELFLKFQEHDKKLSQK